jgi:hypothetical protein
VSYRVAFEGKALTQLYGLPLVALDALVGRVVDLVDAPGMAEILGTGRQSSVTGMACSPSEQMTLLS